MVNVPGEPVVAIRPPASAPALGQLRDGPRGFGTPVLPAGREGPLCKDALALGPYSGHVLCRESPLAHPTLHLLLILPTPRSVRLDPDIEFVIVRVESLAISPEGRLKVDVPAPKAPLGTLPEVPYSVCSA